MTVPRRKQSEKTFTTQTVRLPIELKGLLKHRLADTQETFQTMALRLVLEEIAKTGLPIPTQIAPEASLTKTQRDILAMLEINDFPFNSLKRLVNDALKKYREKGQP